jgi:hypothetical protein
MADQVAAQAQMQNNQNNNAQTIYTQMEADNQKQAMERWKILQDTQTKLFEIMQDVNANRAKTANKGNDAMDQVIRS